MIKEFQGIKPHIDKDAYVAENASLIGDVSIGQGSSIWYNAVLRGDIENITIGKYSNIQDNATLHTGYNIPTKIGDYTVVGHNAIVHGASIGDNCLVGMGAIILNRAKVGDNCIIAAGTLVTENKIIPANSLVIGSPGKVIRQVSEDEIKAVKDNALEYNSLYKKYI